MICIINSSQSCHLQLQRTSVCYTTKPTGQRCASSEWKYTLGLRERPHEMWEHYRQQRKKDSTIGISTGIGGAQSTQKTHLGTLGEEKGLHRGGRKGVGDGSGQVPARSSDQFKGREGKKLPTLIKAQTWTLDWSLRHFIFFLENLNTKWLRSAKCQTEMSDSPSVLDSWPHEAFTSF